MSTPPVQLLMRRPDLEGTAVVATLPEGYAIRQADSADDDVLAEIMTAAFPELPAWTPALVAERLTAAPDVDAVYVVTYDDVPVATASSRHDHERFPGSGYVHWVGSLPGHTGRELGSALLDRLLVDFRERGYRDAVLETDDFRLPAIRVYLRHGYVPITENVQGQNHLARWSAVLRDLHRKR
jgi:mycothiol synthase